MAASQDKSPENQKKPYHWNRVSFALLVAFIIIISWIAYITIADSNINKETFTEFYLKDPISLLKDNNLTVNADEPISFLVVVVNHEGSQSSYQIQIEYNDNVYTSSEYIIDNNKSVEIPVRFSMSTPGKEQRVNIFLGRKGSQFPYRELHLFIDVGLLKMYLPNIRR